MKQILLVLIVLFLSHSAYVGYCAATMDPATCARLNVESTATTDSAQAGSQSAGVYCCTAAPLALLPATALSRLGPSGPWHAIVTPPPHAPSLRLIDPPPRWSAI